MAKNQDAPLAPAEELVEDKPALPVDPFHYEGKQHYPKAIYGKKSDGSIVCRRVETAEEHREVVAEDPDVSWKDGPGDHGLETAPAGMPVTVEKIA